MENIENIINYANGHGNTQLATLSASEVGIGVLDDMQEKLNFASNELRRMEDECGIPLNAEQTARMNVYSKASRHIRKVMLVARKTLSPMITNLSIFLIRKEN